jgi:hypothetical protein
MNADTKLPLPFTVHAIREIRRRLTEEKERRVCETISGKRRKRGTDVWLAESVGHSASYISELLTIDKRAWENPRTSACARDVARLLDLPISIFTTLPAEPELVKAEEQIKETRSVLDVAGGLVGDDDEWEVVLRRRKTPHTEEN